MSTPSTLVPPLRSKPSFALPEGELPDLWKVPLPKLLQAWDQVDHNGRSLEGARALARCDRYYLLIKVLRRYDAWHPWVYARCRELERAPDGHIDIWARNHYKTTLITFAGSLQELLNEPEITIGIFSHSAHIARGFLAQLKRELETNQTLKLLFPDILWEEPLKEAPSWSLENGLIVRRHTNPKEATLEAHGLVEGQPTSKHFKLLVFNDIVTQESVTTPEQIQKTTDAWDLADNLGTSHARKWIEGTRYHYADTYATILKRGSAIARIYPATHDGTMAGRPVLFTERAWALKLRDQSEAIIACQFLANPLAGQQRMFSIADLREYEVRPETLMVYVLIDPARSMKKDSAHTAMLVIGMDAPGNKFLLDGYDHKMDLMERWARMRDLRARWVRMPGVQGVKVGYERYGAIADLDYFHERMRIERAHFDILELEWPREGPGSKVDRVQRLTPDLRAHHLYLPYETDPENLTRNQRRMEAAGYAYRLAAPIRQLDENGEAYDLSERLKMQLSLFPFGGRVDVVDALSRIYDMDPAPPQAPADVMDIEPEVV